jgi:hypothetical protein
MHNDIITQLKTLKAIAPDEGFARRSRTLVLAATPDRAEPVRIAPWLQLASALAFAALLLVISPLFPSAQPVLSSSLDAARLASEFNNLPVNVQLQEIRYQQNANQTIASAVNEITNTSTNHLNTDTITNEAPTLSTDDETGAHIDALLNEISQ